MTAKPTLLQVGCPCVARVHALGDLRGRRHRRPALLDLRAASVQRGSGGSSVLGAAARTSRERSPMAHSRRMGGS